MKRRVLKLLLFVLAMLVGGAIVNVAVAWACALLVDPTRIEIAPMSLKGSVTESWRVDRIDRLGITWIQSAWGRGSPQVVGATEVSPRDMSPAWGNMKEPDPRLGAINLETNGGRAFQVRRVIGAGWPMRSLWYQENNQVGGMVNSTNDGMRGAIDVGLQGWQTSAAFPRMLPVLPIWRGFVVNSVVFAVMLWMVVAMPVGVRRRLRNKRGQCAACGYSLRGTPDITKCPECGHTVIGASRQ